MPPARPKLLFICPCTPDALGTGWEQRAYSFLKAYSQFTDIELWFQPTYDNPNLDRASTLSELCNSITVLAWRPRLLSQNADFLKDRLISTLPNADCVHVNRCTDLARTIDHHCVLWDIDELPWKFRDTSKNMFLRLSEPEKVNYEKMRDAWKNSAVVFSSSQLERVAELKEPIVVPNSHSRSASIQRKPLQNTLLFVGNLNYPPNVDGVLYFASEILPLLTHQVTITIIGRAPLNPDLRAKLDRLKNNECVETFYDVTSCAPFYDRSMASIVPIRFGGGTRIKILESFAAMCPVISTQKGCEGLDVSDGRELLIADTPAAFASACTRLLDNSVLNRKLAKSAHRFYLKKHSQEVIDDVLKSSLDKALTTYTY